MTTIAESLQYAADRLDAATKAMLSIRDQVAAQLAASTTSTTTIINNFLGRPAVQTIFLDPVNGNDANDGLTPARPKKDIDNLLDGLGTTATSIMFLGDFQIKRRRNCYAALAFYGVQPAANAQGYTFVQRTCNFLGTSQDSPSNVVGSFCSGLWLFGTNFSSNFIDYALPAQPANQNYSAHIFSDAGTRINIQGSTLLVAANSAGSLLGSLTNTLSTWLAITLGTNAPGHLFQNVVANGNPNNLYQYRSNVTSA